MTTVAAVYCRKSTSQAGRDADDLSVTRQAANAKAFIASRGWTTDDSLVFVDDGISGGAELRKLPAKKQLIDLIHSGRAPFQALVMQSNDRLSRRDGDEAVSEMKAIAKAGIAIWFYSDGTAFRFGNFADNTLSFLKAEFAAEYRRAVSAKTAEALRRKAQLGHVVGGVTFGFDNIRVNSHTERRINEAEATVVRRIYEWYSAGVGLPTIAHRLNGEGCAAPRAQQGRISGWCPSSIRAVLRRQLYRGEVVIAETRGLDGAVRPELRVSVPHLRVVSPELASAVDERFESQQKRSLRLRNGTLVGRPPGEGSPYLLVGLLRCGVCGGSMEVLSKKAARGKRVYEYRCSVARRKGAAVCANSLPAPMGDTDAAVLASIEGTLMNRAVIERALAHAESLILADRTGDQRSALEAQLADTDAAIKRLTAAIARGGELDPLVSALAASQAQRKDIEARLAEVRAPRPTVDVATVRETLNGYLADWQKLLRGHVHQAQQVIRRLVKDRLTMMPQGSGYYTFTGRGTVRPLLNGVIRNLASPPGFVDSYFELPLTGDNRQVA